MERTETRTNGRRFCTLEVRLRDGRLSICGTAGRIRRSRSARREALLYWTSYFEDAPEEIMKLNRAHGRRFTSAEGAAKFVLDCDGELHGIDVHHTDGDDVYIVESSGQIREELAEYFPEVVPFLAYHLNDVHAECVHQEARGELYDTHPGVECLQCGWKLGHGWNKRTLPEAVVRWAETGEGEPPPPPSAPTNPVFIVQGTRCKPGALGTGSKFVMRGWASDDKAAEARARLLLSRDWQNVMIRGVGVVA